ncbi:hypothetical protein SLH49_05250 [Cognatiyoonia sp. IB215446]|uniref:hypothetical protein n=1 Tax=Cognatiyoonia sp. IB215446 TaxID=3097355 RepID=UPI002A13BE25|nr:hypothetical protein [Cognatiyoonia sp. IB215446]MDX8347388.1 hypothetical protein [Cognatiyoonia sp. IB215446]
MKLYGFLFQWDGFAPHRVSPEAIGDAFLFSLNDVPKFSDISDRHGVVIPKPLPKNWRLFEFISNEPLTKDDSVKPPRTLDRNGYPYWIHIRTNMDAGTVIVAAATFRIAVQAVMTINAYVLPKMQRRNIRVAELAERLLRHESKTEYYVTLLTTDVPGFGEAVKSLSLEGEDIVGAEFFHFSNSTSNDSQKQGLRYTNFTAKRIGLRPIDSRSECGRFGTDNRIEFSDDGLQELEDFLKYVSV